MTIKTRPIDDEFKSQEFDENAPAQSPLETEEGLVFRSQRERYPWYVRTVEKPTIEIDRARAVRPAYEKTTEYGDRFMQKENFPEIIARYPEAGLKRYVGEKRMVEFWRGRTERMLRDIKNKKPGNSLKEVSLFYAAYANQYSRLLDFYELTDKTAWVDTIERFGVEPWRAGELENSAMLDQAARALGASQVGFTLLDPLFVYHDVGYDPDMKYVIMVLTEWAPEASKRMDTTIGDVENRIKTFREQYTVFALRNFIRGLGYKEAVLRGPWPAHAALAGLGELGRMNRLVSPTYGATINLYGLVTNMPLALDKPIDFGLQEFCRRCMKCARACPVGCLSLDKDPSWETKGEWNTPGRKVYYEKSILCASYLSANKTACSLCLANCPWTKQDITVLHQITKAFSAKLPSLSAVYTFMDDLFGYGTTKDPEKLEQWWRLKLPVSGINSLRRSR